ncbi:MAG: 2-oxoacid:acceptor oxidoreductase family protein [Firmicutes bacterium]|jgi:2-oxoglutarate ferredoxin oxidoreductase subunit gamma|nr:2-oxoacid:acceptor oxidoreductase family protein [Bacillota bacterium]
MVEELIIAGFGGQGVMLMGQLLSYAGMREAKNVSWMPSYGPEMRGGTANCSVVISTESVGSPIVTEPTTLIVMNRPSLDRFEQAVRPGGLLIYNSSLIDRKPERTDIRVIAVPAVELAREVGSDRVANMCVLGVYLAATAVVALESVAECLKEVLPERRHDLIPLNLKALARGASMVKP